LIHREALSGQRSMQPHFMLVPSLACPASCSYCFGPHEGPIASPKTMRTAVEFIGKIAAETGQRKIKVTFHGGEPLLAGPATLRETLAGLRSLCGARRFEVAVQSNLWRLDDEFCELLAGYKAQIGTSLDGPRQITDLQRGDGYFERTMSGIRRAQRHGIRVGCTTTFTSATLPHWREVLDFFLAERLGLSIHPCVPSLDRPRSPHTITPEQYARLLRKVLEFYIEHRREISISSLDQMCRSATCGTGQVCTFRDCLGMFLAIDPMGDIYPCQRLCGHKAWRLGNLADGLTLENLFGSPVGRRLAHRQAQVKAACRDCPHVDYCRGGCPYNAWASRNGNEIRDPYCVAYRATFDLIQKRLSRRWAPRRISTRLPGCPTPAGATRCCAGAR
jgi:uncharacterized protein